ncbi:phage major capsid protein [Methylorubrum extorquens]|uniref:Phage major capsid protein, HK97 family n=1 Tax=Methylorubrum extorquens DSM 13060 TaxID=882800 RepID=H1KHR7_METEX|nr:phage major capsid protein [Methylorubrum extorquens]EHP92945.1 phage major capsid protein, HK97 family [Methylorubrum extorquens DSM 13060]
MHTMFGLTQHVTRVAPAMPRAIVGQRVYAHTDPAKVISDLTSAFASFKADHESRMDNVQAAYDDLASRIAAGNLGGLGSSRAPEDPEYSRTFASYARKGHGEQTLSEANNSGDRARIQAAMSAGSNGDGGYLAPVEWDRNIVKALTVASPLRSLCTVVTTSGPGYSTLWNDGQWGSGWVGETASRPQTTTAQLANVVFKPGEIFAQPAITQQLLDDAAINLEQWLSDEVADTFARQEAIAFVSGDGLNKPQGFLSYIGSGTTLHPGGEPLTTPSGHASQITSDGLVDLVYALGAPYRTNASWLMNSASIAKVSKLKDGQGNYLWQPSFIAGQPPTLLGRPVYFEESMPDVAAGTLPIAVGDWRRFYVINDRVGVRILRDAYTAKPYVLFYTTKRVGGGVLDPKAVRFLKVGAAS